MLFFLFLFRLSCSRYVYLIINKIKRHSTERDSEYSKFYWAPEIISLFISKQLSSLIAQHELKKDISTSGAEIPNDELISKYQILIKTSIESERFQFIIIKSFISWTKIGQ